LQPHQVIIITGASRGLGRSLALRLGKPHTAVLVHYRDRKDKAEEVVKQLMAQGVQAMAHAADVRSVSEVQMMIKTVLSLWKRVDLLIHNAGVRQDGLVIKMKDEAWDAVVETHLAGAFHCLSNVIEPMKDQKGGHVIFISSMSGQEGRAGQSNYAAAKAGLLGLMHASAIELGPWNIRVNTVLPGLQLTEMTRSLPPKTRQALMDQNVLGRPSSIEEATGFIEWLASTQNISGQVFNLDSRFKLDY
jgi:3-oxoacyl-[acyl-carrier protein] reductase